MSLSERPESAARLGSPAATPCVTTQERLGKIDYAEFNRLIRKAQQRVETCRRPCLRTAPRLSPWTS